MFSRLRFGLCRRCLGGIVACCGIRLIFLIIRLFFYLFRLGPLIVGVLRHLSAQSIPEHVGRIVGGRVRTLAGRCAGVARRLQQINHSATGIQHGVSPNLSSLVLL